MNLTPVLPSDSPELRLQRFWKKHGDHVLQTVIVVMGIAATVWLAYEFWRLLFQTGSWGAVDLKLRHEETHAWFAGQQVYSEFVTASYPPASSILLWPFLGWTTFPLARWIWAATTVLALAWLTKIFLKESRAQSRQERLLIALCPFAAYATGATIGNGQIMVHILPCLVMACLMLDRKTRRGANGVAAVLLFLFALVKPTVAAPFFWIFLFTARRLWPSLLVVSGYAGLTLWAAAFQERSVLQLMMDWLVNSATALSGIAIQYSNGNIHSVLVWLGKGDWTTAASLIMLAALGIWTCRFRETDIWILLGVAALVSRLYTYHGWYDDALILLPMISVFRISKAPVVSLKTRTTAAILFAVCLVFMIAPGGLYLLPPPLNRVYVAVQVCIWLTMLVFLLNFARHSQRS